MNYPPSVAHTRGHARVRAAATPLAFRRDAGRPATVAVADAVQGVPRPRPIQRAEEGPTRNARSPAARFGGRCQKQQRRSESARPGPSPRQGIRPGPRWIRETRERRSAVGQAASSQAPGRSRHGGRGHRRGGRRRRRGADLRPDGRGGRRPLPVATRSHDEAPGQPRRHPGAVRAGQRETRGVRGLHHVPEVSGGVPQGRLRPKLFGPSAGTRLCATKPKERRRQAQEGAAREVNRPARATRRHGRPEGGGADGERALGRGPGRG